MRITNKEKQGLSGNWGKPDKSEQSNWTHKLKDFVSQEVPKHNAKKKKVAKKPWGWKYSCCPFCEAQLKELPKEESKESFVFSWRKKYEKECTACGAKEVPDCPCCHNETWVSKDEIYKHHALLRWCTFEGKRKVV